MANLIDTPNGPIHLTPGSCVGLAIPAGWLPRREREAQAERLGIPLIRYREQAGAPLAGADIDGVLTEIGADGREWEQTGPKSYAEVTP